MVHPQPQVEMQNNFRTSDNRNIPWTWTVSPNRNRRRGAGRRTALASLLQRKKNRFVIISSCTLLQSKSKGGVGSASLKLPTKKCSTQIKCKSSVVKERGTLKGACYLLVYRGVGIGYRIPKGDRRKKACREYKQQSIVKIIIFL